MTRRVLQSWEEDVLQAFATWKGSGKGAHGFDFGDAGGVKGGKGSGEAAVKGNPGKGDGEYELVEPEEEAPEETGSRRPPEPPGPPPPGCHLQGLQGRQLIQLPQVE